MGEGLPLGRLHLGMCYDQAHFRKIALRTSVEDGLGKIESRMPVRCWNVSSRYSMEREGRGDEKMRRGVYLKRPFNIRVHSTPTQPSRCLDISFFKKFPSGLD